MSIIQIIVTCVGYLASIILTIKTFIDEHKKKNLTLQCNSAVDVNAKLEVLSKVADLCVEAEKLVGKGNGAIKELYVTCHIDKMASERGIIITQDEIKAEIDKTLSAPQKKVTT